MPGDGEGNKESFCLLLWRSNGGRVTDDLRIARQGFNLEGEIPQYSRGYCTKPYDCYSCDILQEEIHKHPPGSVIWLCIDCVKQETQRCKEAERPFHLPGFYTEGHCQSPECERPAGPEGLIRYSRFLQLFIR